MQTQPTWHNHLFDEIRAEGFPLVGIVDIELAMPHFEPHFERYSQWLDEGQAGEMRYLVRGKDRRKDPRNVFPAAESVLCVALPYSKLPHGDTNPEDGIRYARYLRGRDYHDEIPERLERALAAYCAKHPEMTEGLTYKICVDTSAILERSWAHLAGLGWIGKNTMLINPKYGSYLLLGEILINRKSGIAPAPHANFCGSCTRCLDGCPTKALSAGKVTTERCISYWTLEKRGPLDLSEEDKKAMGNWAAGCDICQEVCPFNNKAQEIPASEQPSQWQALARETEEQYKARVKSSALNRVKPAMFKRNLEIIRKT